MRDPDPLAHLLFAKGATVVDDKIVEFDMFNGDEAKEMFSTGYD